MPDHEATDGAVQFGPVQFDGEWWRAVVYIEKVGIDAAGTEQTPAVSKEAQCSKFNVQFTSMPIHLGLSVGVATAEFEARTPSAMSLCGWASIAAASVAAGIGVGIAIVAAPRTLVRSYALRTVTARAGPPERGRPRSNLALGRIGSDVPPAPEL